MTIRVLHALMALTSLVLVGCGEGTSTPPATPFELDGKWTYLGPVEGTHDLTVGHGTMMYADDLGAWSSSWTIKSHDDASDHFQVTFASGTGTYLPVGQSMSGTYQLNGTVLTVQLASGLTAYPPLKSAGSCTAESDGTPVPECRLYIKKN